MSAITEKTYLPISMVVIVVLVVVWGVRLEGRVNASEKREDARSAEQHDQIQLLQRIDRRTARIEGHLRIESHDD